MTLDEAIRHCYEEQRRNIERTVEYANAYDRENADACAECAKEHKQLAEWLEELRDRRSAPDHELISRNAAIEAVRSDLEWLGSRDGPAAVSAIMRLRVFDPIYELNRRYPGYSVLPRDCIERTMTPEPPEEK